MCSELVLYFHSAYISFRHKHNLPQNWTPGAECGKSWNMEERLPMPPNLIDYWNNRPPKNVNFLRISCGEKGKIQPQKEERFKNSWDYRMKLKSIKWFVNHGQDHTLTRSAFMCKIFTSYLNFNFASGFQDRVWVFSGFLNLLSMRPIP